MQTLTLMAHLVEPLRLLQLGFGKSMPTNCVWIDGCGENLTEKSIYRVFKKYGEVTYTFVDRKKWRALVFFTNLDDAQFAVNEMKGRPLGKRRIMVCVHEYVCTYCRFL